MGAIVETQALPSRLGRFEIRGALGRGGSGQVVEAWDPARGEAVALKILGHVDARAFARFKREFRAIAELAHPNLVALHELFLEDGRLFFSMERLEGVPLLEWVRPSGQLDVARLRDAMRQLARGTAALHAAGKLHRDIKSSNVFVTREGRVVLLDLGFVLDPSSPSLDLPGHVVGTPAYMSPEQAFGLQVGTASDWYSVGVVLYESLTGQAPFPDRDPKVLLRKRMSREPPPPSSRVDDELPGDLEALCVGLLRRVGSARPDVGAILATLGGPLPEHLTQSTEGAGSAAALIGRRDELTRILEAAQRVEPTRPVLVFVHGRSGIGKSALLGSLAAQLGRERGFRVWRGRCYERESLPYKAFEGFIDALVEDLEQSDLQLTHVCNAADVHALVRIFPTLSRITGVQGTSFAIPGPATTELRDRAYAALQRVLVHMSAAEPIAVLIDDLQWCDPDSIRLLSELARPPAAPRVLFVGAYSDDRSGADAPLARALTRLRDAGPGFDHVDVELRPLDEASAHALATALLAEHGIDRPTLAARLARESEGSPRLLHELVEHVRAHPELADTSSTAFRTGLSIERILQDRVADLSTDARAVLETIAVAGQRVEQGVVLRAALGDDATATPIDSLRRQRLVAASGFTDRDWIEPVHDELRRHVLDALDPGTRRERHLALARALAGSARSDPEILATHYAHGGADELAARHALYSASLANEALAFDLATHWYALALAHLPHDDQRRAEVRVSLGHALANSGRGYEGAQALLETARESTDVARTRQLRRLAAHWLVYSGDDAGRELLAKLLKEAGLSFPESRVGAIAMFLVLRARVRFRGLAFEERDASEIPVDLLHRIDLCWAIGLVLNADPILAAGFLARHLLLALESGDPARIAPALAYETVGRMVTARITADEARTEMQLAGRLAERNGNEEAVTWVDFMRPVVATTSGAWKAGLEQARHAARSLQTHATGSGLPVLTCQHLEMWCRFQLGEWATLDPLVHHMIAAGGRANPHREGARSLLAFPLSLAADQPERALEILAGQAERIASSTDRGAPFRFFARTFTHLYQGDGEAAWAWVSSQRRQLERSLRLRPAISKSFFLWPCVAAAAARAAAGDGAVVRRARKDADRLASLPFRPAAALAELAHATLDAATGERARASERFAAAATAFEELDMAIHAAVARHRRGTLSRGSEGARVVDEARATMRAAGVLRPDLLAAALAPGTEA